MSEIEHHGVVAMDQAGFQERVGRWLDACFGPAIAADRQERNDRFIEEALELAQATGYSADRAHALVDYVFNRPVGDPAQEAGGVHLTFASLCLANGLDMDTCGEAELARVWEKIDKIRAKQAAKPTGSALPIAVAQPAHPDDLAVDRFAAAMKANLAQKRNEGRSGWDNPDECTVEFLSELLRDHVSKGDPVDVGNFAMMIHQRGATITAARSQGAEVEPVAFLIEHSTNPNEGKDLSFLDITDADKRYGFTSQALYKRPPAPQPTEREKVLEEALREAEPYVEIMHSLAVCKDTRVKLLRALKNARAALAGGEA